MRVSPVLLLATATWIMLVGTTPAQAQAPEYNFFDAAYVENESDFAADKADGWLVRTSGGYRRFHFNAEYRDTDRVTWYAGFGWHGLLGKRADLVLEAHYMDTEVLTRVGQVKEAGLFGRGGFRWQVIQMLELNAFATYFDLGDIETDVAYEGNVILNLTARFAIGVGWESNFVSGDDGHSGKAYLRFMPGTPR